MPKEQLFPVFGSNVPGTNADTYTREPYIATVLDQSGNSALFSTITKPTVATGADIAGGALVTATAYKWIYTALGPLGETLGNEFSRTLAASQSGQTLTLTQMAGATAYRIYRTQTAGATNTEQLAYVIQAPPNIVATATFAITDLGVSPVTGVSIPRIDTTTFPSATGAPGTAITGATGATTAGSKLTLLSAWQYKYTAVNFLGESTPSAASATFTLTGTQNNFTGITLTNVAGAQYYNIYRAPVVASVAGNFTYLTTVNANNATSLQAITTFIDDGNYKGSSAQPPTVDGTAGANPQPIGKVLVSPYFSTLGTNQGNWHVNCVNGQQVNLGNYGVIVANEVGITPPGGQAVVWKMGVVNALVNTAANFYTALTAGTLATNAPGPLTNAVVPGTPLMLDGAGYLCPVGSFAVAAASTQLPTGTLPGQVVGYALGTVGINQIQSIPVAIGGAY